MIFFFFFFFTYNPKWCKPKCFAVFVFFPVIILGCEIHTVFPIMHILCLCNMCLSPFLFYLDGCVISTHCLHVFFFFYIIIINECVVFTCIPSLCYSLSTPHFLCFLSGQKLLRLFSSKVYMPVSDCMCLLHFGSLSPQHLTASLSSRYTPLLLFRFIYLHSKPPHLLNRYQR